MTWEFLPKTARKQECIPAGCVPPACRPYSVVSDGGGGEWGGLPNPECRPPPWMQTPLDAVPSPPVDRMTKACKNITLPQSSFAGGNEELDRGKRP